MNLKLIVEGYGEVEAAPVLVRRLLAVGRYFKWECVRPIRASRSELLKEQGIKRLVQLARKDAATSAILVLFDADDDCPKDLASCLTRWIGEAARPIPAAVVLAKREYEAWFLAALESLGGCRGINGKKYDGDPEGVRGAKEILNDFSEQSRSYAPTADQPAMSAKFDMALSYARSRSFRKLVKAVGDLLGAAGEKTKRWPPKSITGKVHKQEVR